MRPGSLAALTDTSGSGSAGLVQEPARQVEEAEALLLGGVGELSEPGQTQSGQTGRNQERRGLGQLMTAPRGARRGHVT